MAAGNLAAAVSGIRVEVGSDLEVEPLRLVCQEAVQRTGRIAKLISVRGYPEGTRATIVAEDSTHALDVWELLPVVAAETQSSGESE